MLEGYGANCVPRALQRAGMVRSPIAVRAAAGPAAALFGVFLPQDGHQDVAG
jgi:hypothetical protein